MLFLDEAPEFRPYALNALRQPLEDGWVTLARSQGSLRYPAQIQLVLAANPCPCGVGNNVACTCSSVARRRYLGRLSGPLLDRIDLQVTLAPVTAAALAGEHRRAGVLRRGARSRRGGPGRGGAAVGRAPVRGQCRAPLARCCADRRSVCPSAVTAELARLVDRGTLSARGYDRVLRIAWTIVDLDGRTVPTKSDVDEALQLRIGDGP